ncbi:hypothetical protein DM860_003239 [Cuscuta australis]|uniref:Protein kinase domain-containing protein n=1 Tax=Cuscuta australis TaxID=267555 RepID=A0A328D2L6_9ASTE|nr:hypothetical protein DM860_003239 [Cuscuta australis]
MVRRLWRVVWVLAFLLLVDFTFEQLLSSRTERFALLQLRSSLGLRAREWPVKVGPCSGWAGVSCVNGSVVGINISGFKRTRKGSRNPRFLVDALQNLTMLTSFNASLFLLPGPIPGWFGLKMSSLQVLDLTSCSINGSLPASLGNLTSLTQLHLSRNGLTGTVPSSLGELPNLSVLDLSHNSLNGAIPPSFGALSKLRFLNLSGNSFSSSIPSEIGNLYSLTGLDLSHNSLSGSLPASVFPPLTKLKFLVMGHNNFTGSFPAALWSMPLQFLDASANRFTGSLPNITLTASAPTTFFDLSQNEFYGYLTTVVQGFSFIDLSGNYIEGKVPTYVHGNVSISRNCLQNVKNQKGGSECGSFYKARGLVFDSGQPNATQPPPLPPRHNKSHRKTIILAAVLGGVGLIAVILISVVLLMIWARKNTASQGGTGVGPAPTTSTTSSSPPPPPGLSLNLSSLGDAFTYQQILQATSDFKDENLMKHGHSGDLFRGLLEGGVPVVIKRIDLQSVKREVYLVELDFFSKVSHTRIVPLLGHCLENENQKFLVYKYMPNGDLSSSLFKKNDSDDDSLQSLDWITRLKIAIGAAEALSYLHHESTPPRVHRDVQSSSILLDDKFEVRLGSLSEVCAQEADPHQSRISRFLRLQQTSDQSSSGSHSASCTYDVYCFGKVLLELVTGRLGLSGPDGDGNAKEWLDRILPYISIYEKELVTKIVDPSLIIDEDLLEEVWAMAIVARSCLNPKPSRRPLMRYILKALENPLKVVREEHSVAAASGSARLKAAASSSRGSWNAATLFGSWRQSSSDVRPKAHEGTAGSFKRSRTSGSQGSGPNNGEGGAGGGGHSSSSRRSKEIFPEPLEEDGGGRPAE